MGKIYDALEKSRNRASAGAPVPEQVQAREIVQSKNGNTIARKAIDSRLITYHAPRSMEADLFKVLRTNLLFPANGKAPRIILVTSALPGDGKSFISSNLAISIAQGVEEHVLLIDCDIRKPTIHSHFGFEAVSGLSEYLADAAGLAQILLKTDLPKLTILPAGNPPQNPTELLTSRKMKTMLEEVNRRYDDRFIIVDSPPPSMAAETSALINYIDAVLLVVKSAGTPRQAVMETIAQIGKEKIIGVVLNHSDQTVRKTYGYEKSYYESISK